jgi:hypothetical protein
MPRRLIALPIGLLAASLGLVSAAPASAAPGMEVAFQDDALMLKGGAEYALDAGRGIGATTVRINVRWSEVNGRQAHGRRAPRRPAYDFAALDRAVAAARARKFKVQLTLTSPAPAWATSNRRVGGTGVDPVKFGRFAGTVARRYRGQVARYSIWNEPNLRSWLHGRNRRETPAARYRKLYLRGYTAIKGADRHAAVLIGELAPYGKRKADHPVAFLRRVTCTSAAYRRARGCAGLKADGVAVHPYEFAHRSATWRHRNPDVVSIGSLRRFNHALGKLRRAGALRTPKGRTPGIYLTEFGHFAPGSRRAIFNAAGRGRYLTAAYTAALRAPNVKQILQYMLVRQPWASWDMGLINPRTHRADAGYHALHTWSARQARAAKIAR